MERRRDVRVSLDQKVRVTVLGRRVLGTNDWQVDARAADLSGRGIRILAPARIASGDAVRIDLEDAMLLGEVCYCQPHNDGFMIGVQLDQALSNVGELARLPGRADISRSPSAPRRQPSPAACLGD